MSGRTEMVALSWSLVGILSGRRRALESNSSEGGTFFSRLSSSHCASCILRASSDMPYALIPLALQACWSSAGVRDSIPSFCIACNKAQYFHPPPYYPLYPNIFGTSGRAIAGLGYGRLKAIRHKIHSQLLSKEPLVTGRKGWIRRSLSVKHG